MDWLSVRYVASYVMYEMLCFKLTIHFQLYHVGIWLVTTWLHKMAIIKGPTCHLCFCHEAFQVLNSNTYSINGKHNSASDCKSSHSEAMKVIGYFLTIVDTTDSWWAASYCMHRIFVVWNFYFTVRKQDFHDYFFTNHYPQLSWFCMTILPHVCERYNSSF